MKKRFLSVFLVLAMVLSLAPGMSLTAAAEEKEVYSETIAFSQVGETASEHFTLRATGRYDEDGWFVADHWNYRITITAKDDDLDITAIDAVIGYRGDYYHAVAYSSGEKAETGVGDGSTVHVININAKELTITCSEVIQFKDITVHFTTRADHVHSFAGAYRNNGDGTHLGRCTICGKYGAPESHRFIGDYKDNGDGTHSQKCAFCNECGAPESHSFTGAYKDNGDGTHSRKCAFCTEYGAPESHSFTRDCKDNGDGTHSGQCAFCGTYSAAASHTFVSGVCACGKETLREVIAFSGGRFAESEHFTLYAKEGYDGDGWTVRDLENSMTITASDECFNIVGIDAVIGYYGMNYPNVAYSSGEKVETGGVGNGSTVHVININANQLAITCPGICQFKEITVYYMADHTAFTDTYRDNGNGTHSRLCATCGEYGAEESHSFTGDYKDNCDGTHSRKCPLCDAYGAEESHSFTGDYKDNGDGTHSRKCAFCDKYGAEESHTFVDGTCVCSAWEGEIYSEVIAFNSETDAESAHFTLHVKQCERDGWLVMDIADSSVTITAKDDRFDITAIDAVIGAYGYYYPDAAYSSGEKTETDSVEDGSTVHVTDINASELTITSSEVCEFKDITVYYTVSDHNHEYTGDYKSNGDGTHSRKCAFCDKYGATESHTFVNCVCVCGEERYAEDLVFNNEADAESEHFALHTNGECDGDGWTVRGLTDSRITIISKDACLDITAIEAVVSIYGNFYSTVVYSSGEKVETGNVDNNSVVHVININAKELVITSTRVCQLKDITVFYGPGHDFTGAYRDNGDGTHSRKCVNCGEYGEAESHTFVNGVCACGTGRSIIVGAGETLDLNGETLTVENALTVNNGGKVVNGALRIKDGAVVSLGANGGWVPVPTGSEGGYTTYELREVAVKLGKDIADLGTGARFALGYKYAEYAAYGETAAAAEDFAGVLKLGACISFVNGDNELSGDLILSKDSIAKMAEVDAADAEAFYRANISLKGSGVKSISAAPLIAVKALGFRLQGAEGNWVK